MAPRKNATPKRRSRVEIRKTFHVAFVHCVDKSGLATPPRVARELRVTTVTARNWLRGDHRIDLETLAMSGRLWPHFLRCLVVAERKARVI